MKLAERSRSGKRWWRIWRLVEVSLHTSTILHQPPPTCFSSRRPMHRPAAQHMQMKMKDRLATIGVGVHDDTVASARDSRLLGDVARKQQQLAQRRGLLGVVQRAHVRRGNDEPVRGRLRIEVLERQHAVGALDHRGRNLAGGDLTKDAAAAHSSPPPPLRRRLWRDVCSSSRPRARRTVSQNLLPDSSTGGSSSISLSFSSSLRCSALSLLGVQTWIRTCRSPWPPSPRRGSPLARSR